MHATAAPLGPLTVRLHIDLLLVATMCCRS